MSGSQVTAKRAPESDDCMRVADGRRSIEMPNSEASPPILVDGVCDESTSAQAANSSNNGIVVSKGRNGFESDCVYNSDSETTRPTRP